MKSLRIMKIDRQVVPSFEKPSYHQSNQKSIMKCRRYHKAFVNSGRLNLSQDISCMQAAEQLDAQLKSARRQRVLIQTGAKELRKTLKPWFHLFLDMAKKIRAIPEFSAAPLHQKNQKRSILADFICFWSFLVQRSWGKLRNCSYLFRHVQKQIKPRFQSFPQLLCTRKNKNG